MELWTVPAEELLAAGDVGMIPGCHWRIGMVRQSQFSISLAAPASTRMPFPRRANLLAVSQVLAGLRYDDPRLFQIFEAEKS